MKILPILFYLQCAVCVKWFGGDLDGTWVYGKRVDLTKKKTAVVKSARESCLPNKTGAAVKT